MIKYWQNNLRKDKIFTDKISLSILINIFFPVIIIFSVIEYFYPANLTTDFRISFALNFILFALNFALIAIIALLVAILRHINNLHKTENLAKDRVLKVINKINQVKLSVPNINDLVNLICQKLEEDLGGKFYIILTEDINKVDSNTALHKAYGNKIKQVLKSKVADATYQMDKIIYFQPMCTIHKDIGILIAEIDYEKTPIYPIAKLGDKNFKKHRTHKHHPQGFLQFVAKKMKLIWLIKFISRNLGFGIYITFSSNLRKSLMVLSDQISIIIDNSQTRLRLSEAKVNEEKEKLRSLILSSISHDLKTPLASIIGSLSIFDTMSEQKKLNKRNRKTLITTALEEAERLNDFISDVLEMTRIESGGLRIHKQFLNPSLMIEKILKRFNRKLKEYQLEIALNNKIEIKFDQISFEQVIQNLIDNIIKYCPKKTKITIYDQLDSNHYRIFIKDQGRGIDSAKLNLIFNKFERFALEDKSSNASGSGLGLAIVRALMDINNATIAAKNSESEKGAIFILEFKEFRTCSPIVNNVIALPSDSFLQSVPKNLSKKVKISNKNSSSKILQNIQKLKEENLITNSKVFNQ